MRTLYDRHGTRVYRSLLRIVFNAACAEELLSEVFIDVWNQAGRFENGRATSTTSAMPAPVGAGVIVRPAHDGGVAVGREGNGPALDGISNRVVADQLRPLLRELRQRELRGKDQGGDDNKDRPEKSQIYM
jgi:hypothetical protein